MGVLFIAIAAFVGVAALVGGVAMAFREPAGGRLEDRLQVLTGQQTPSSGETARAQKSVLSQPLDAVPNLLEKLAGRFGNIDRIFEQADTNLTLGRMLMFSVLMAVGGGAVALALHSPPVGVGIAAPIMASVPWIWLKFRRGRRLKAFAAQLPEAMDMLGRSLRSGQSLAAGFNMVSTEMPLPVGKEFGRVFEEQNLGLPLEESLRAMTERIPNLDLKFFATAVILQRQTGGDLAEILDKIASLIRDRFRIWGQVQALTGEGRLSGIVLMALPFVLFMALYYLNRDYVMLLFTDPLGRKMLTVAVVMQLIGAFFIRKIVNIKV